MENDLNDKIKEIGSMFGISEMPENIGEIVSSFLSSKTAASEAPASQETQCGQPCDLESEQVSAEQEQSQANIGHTNSSGSSSDLFEDIDMAKVLRLLNKYKEAKKNKTKDKKIQLLYAVEPFLNDKRKDKVNNCVKFLTFADLAKEFKDI